MSDHIDALIDRLTFINYACNRDAAPEITPERWARIYPNVEALEAKYQAEKVINRARFP